MTRSLYDYPLYYDIAFSRDVAPEISFFGQCLAQWAQCESSRALELGCGPAYHSESLARTGYEMIALDSNPTMIEYASQRLGDQAENITFIQGDMRDFDLSEKVDLVVCMLASVALILTLDDMIAHFEAVARNLNEGGLYIMEISHPRDLFTNSGNRPTAPGWQAHRGQISINMQWGEASDPVDPIREVHSWKVTAEIKDSSHSRTLQYTEEQAIWTRQEIEAAARLAGGLEIVAWYGAFDTNQTLNNSRWSWRMIPVLRRIS
ncbi:MAG: class I SAM-dependent methyltransferase [Candidatus Latescibacteria bacterium]|jgi:SAM-dependent methyltransferase|nr:class I SAM-dependent methyltransferase [Candidatus Latescibacterota bacterium]